MGADMITKVATSWFFRLWAFFGFLVWGAFLVEHLKEWVFYPASGPALPQFVIWVLVLHSEMVLGLFGTAFQIRIMAALAVISPAGFFLGVIGVSGIGFFIITIPPPIYVLFMGRKSAIKK